MRGRQGASAGVLASRSRQRSSAFGPSPGLGGGEAEIVAGPRVLARPLGLELLEEGFRLGRDHAALRDRQRLGEAGLRARVVGGERRGLAVGGDGGRRVVEGGLRAGQHQPALEVVGLVLQPGLEPGHHLLDLRRGALRQLLLAGGQRLVRQVGGAEVEVEGGAQRRDEDGRGQEDEAPLRRGAGRRGLGGARRAQQAAFDLEPGGGRLLGPDQAAREVAVDLGQLVAVDGELVRRFGGATAGAQEGPQQGGQRRQREGGGGNDERGHEEPPSGSARRRSRRARSSGESSAGRSGWRRRER